MSSKSKSNSSPSKPLTESRGANSKSAQVQDQVNEVVGVMQQNIDKVMERGERLDNLQNKTEDLSNSAGAFRRGATKVRREMWWKNMKLKALVFIIVVAVLLAIILPLVLGGKSDKPA